MSETAVKTNKVRKVHHTGRLSQIGIYLGKQLRFFINESDWKVLPMAAIIAGLVGMVIRKRFWLNMEGDLIGAFAIACVATASAGSSSGSIAPACISRPTLRRI